MYIGTKWRQYAPMSFYICIHKIKCKIKIIISIIDVWGSVRMPIS